MAGIASVLIVGLLVLPALSGGFGAAKAYEELRPLRSISYHMRVFSSRKMLVSSHPENHHSEEDVIAKKKKQKTSSSSIGNPNLPSLPSSPEALKRALKKETSPGSKQEVEDMFHIDYNNPAIHPPHSHARDP